MLRGGVLSIVACLAVILLSSMALGFPSGLSPTDPEQAVTLNDGQRTLIAGIFVDRVIGDYAFGRLPRSGSTAIPIYAPYFQIPLFSSVEVTGSVWTAGGKRIILAEQIRMYTTGESGRMAPPMFGFLDPSAWQFMSLLPNLGTIPGASDIPTPPDPTAMAAEPSKLSAPVGTVASAKIGSTALVTAGARLASTPPQFISGPITLTSKTVSAAFQGFFYIEETDRSCGIKIESPVLVEAGELVNIDGTVIPSSSSIAECYVLANSIAHVGWAADVPRAVSMPQRMLAGGVFGQQQATYKDTTVTPSVPGVGLNPIGLRVTTYGRLTAPFQENGNTAWYIEDGSNLKLTTSGGAQTGLKLVSWEGCATPTDQGGNTYSAIGILGAEMDAASLPVPVVRMPCPNLSVNITTPPAGELHIASGQTSVIISGAASAPGTGVAKVEVKIDSGAWQPAAYDHDTHAWTYTWQSPSSATIYAKVTDYSANALDVSRVVTVTTGLGVIYVKPNGTGNGTSWTDARGTIQAAIDAAYAAQPKKEVWVAAGTYSENSPAYMKSGVRMYGGFAGAETETAREHRDWALRQSILDGSNNWYYIIDASLEEGYAVDDTAVDGFTFQNGQGNAAIRLTDYGMTVCNNSLVNNRCIAVYCLYSPSRIINNIITNNDSNGIYCGSSAAIISHNQIMGNTGYGIYCENGDPTITNNVIASNGKPQVYSEGISCLNSNASIVGNTIAYNTGRLGSGSGIGISGSGYSPTVANNIVAFNKSGIYKSSSSTPVFKNNDVWGNTNNSGYWLPNCPSGGTDADGNTIKDPVFARPSDSDFHIQPNSGCRDAGTNTYATWDTDIDNQQRIENSTVDIGADESDGCGVYAITFSCDPAYTTPGGSVNVKVHIADWNNQAVANGYVTSTISGGTITHVNGYSVPGPEYGGLTNVSGDVTFTVTRNTPGHAFLSAHTARSCGEGGTSETRAVGFIMVEDNWPMFQHDIAHTGVTTTTLGSNLVKKWDIPLAGATSGTLWSSPVVVNGVVYIGTDSGILYAIDATDGTLIAQTNLSSPIWGTPCVDGGKVYVGTSNGTLHVLYAADQAVHDPLAPDWTLAFSGQALTGGITVWNGAAYFGTYTSSTQGYLRTVDIATRMQRGYAGTPFKPDYATPGIDTLFGQGSRCYISDESCVVTAANCYTGAWVWNWQPDNTTFMSSPTVCRVGNYTYIVGGSSGGPINPYVYRIIDNGGYAQLPTPYKFTASGAVVSTVATLGGKLYFGSRGGNIYRVDAATFQQADWVNSFPGTAFTSSALISEPTGLLFVCSEDGKVHVLDTVDGSASLLYDTSIDISGSTMRGSPAASGGRLYIVAGNASGRYLYCFGL